MIQIRFNRFEWRGGGIERAFSSQMRARIEYLYDDFGSKTYVTGADTYTVHVTGQTLRGAVTLNLP